MIATVSMSKELPAAPPAAPPAVSSGRPDSTGAGLQELFEEHHQLIFNTAYRVTGNANDAEDVLQTIFLRLLKRPPTALQTASAGGYLRRAAINASLDQIRSRKRSRLVALDQQLIEEVKPALDGRSDPGRRFAGLELRGRLRRELAKVNPRAAEMFVLRYFEGYRNSEIGPMMGTSRMTVAVTLHRLRKRLRAVLADELHPAESRRVSPEADGTVQAHGRGDRVGQTAADNAAEDVRPRAARARGGAGVVDTASEGARARTGRAEEGRGATARKDRASKTATKEERGQT